MYRELAKEKTVKRRIVLTRGEVRDILRAYLSDNELAPQPEPEDGCDHLLACFAADNKWHIELPDMNTALWEDAPCFAVEWNEELSE